MKHPFLPPSKTLLLISVSLSLLLASCWSTFKKEVDPPDPGTNGYNNYIQPEAYVPVYGKDTLTRGIVSMAPQPIEKAGKIYVYGNLLFQVENQKGIHVIDYSDRKQPVKLGFIRCKGTSELAVKGGYLITNNMNDLVTIDIHQLDGVKEVGRITNAFPHFYMQQYQEVRPAASNVYYVCPDFTKGDVIEWKLEKNVSSAWCRTN